MCGLSVSMVRSDQYIYTERTSGFTEYHCLPWPSHRSSLGLDPSSLCRCDHTRVEVNTSNLLL